MKEMIGKVKDIAFKSVILLIAMLGVWLRVLVYSFNRSLWMDEAALANNLTLPHTILDNMQYQQAAPPLFKLVSLFNVQTFGDTEYVYRLFPLLCGIAAIGVFWLIVKKVFSSKLAQIAAMAMFSVNYLLIYYSSEFKQYSSDVLFALLLVYFALKINIKTCTPRCIALLAVFYASVFWMSHASLFVLAGIFLYHLFGLFMNDDFVFERPNRHGLIRFISLYLPAGMSFAALWFLHLHTVASSDFMHSYWAEYFINSSENLLKTFSATTEMVFFPNKTYLTIALVIVLGLICLFKHNVKNACVLTLPFFVLLAASYFGFYPLGYRLILFVVPLILIYYCAILDVKNRLALVLALILFAAGIPSYFNYYPKVIASKNIWLREELRTLYEYLEMRMQPDDIIFLANDMHQQNMFYMKKFKFPNKLIETRKGTDIPYSKMEPGKRYRVLFDCYWSEAKRGKFAQLVNWLKANTNIISQYAYYENYVFYVEKKP